MWPKQIGGAVVRAQVSRTEARKILLGSKRRPRSRSPGAVLAPSLKQVNTGGTP
jgi:hypothetical protein